MLIFLYVFSVLVCNFFVMEEEVGRGEDHNMYHVLFTRHYSLGPGSALSEKGEKIGVGGSEANREVVWGGDRVAEPGDVPLMPPIRSPAINLSLKCQHVKFSRMSA